MDGLIRSSLEKWALMLSVWMAAVLLQPAAAEDQAASDKLVFLNWAEYLEPDVASEFRDQFDTLVTEIYFESDTGRNILVAESEGRGLDLAIVDGAAMKFYRDRGWLAPISAEQVPNLRHINYRWQNAFPAAEGVAVPYFWGTTGIAYRADLVEQPLTEWMDLFRPADELCGKIVMPEDVRELVGLALRALGYPEHDASSGQLAEAQQLLTEQRPCVAEYGYLNLTESSELVTGDVLATVLYNGDAIMLQEFEEEIAFEIPTSGSILWVDYLVVFATSSNKDKAYQFIDFLNRPEIAARQAEYVYFATPNEAAASLLDEEFLEDPTIYPGQAVIDASSFQRPLSPRQLQRFNSVYASVVGSGGSVR